MSTVEIQAKDGGHFSAYIALPKITPAPAIILIQEIFGVNKEMRDKCDHLADLGYVAICPDLFWRIEPGIDLVDSVEAQLQRAFELFGLFDQQKGLQDLITTLDFIRNDDRCSGKVGAAGYCLGGKMAYMLAANSDVDATISYYGVGLESMLKDAEKFQSPVLLHIAGEDQFVPKDAQDQIIETMKDNDFAETFRYPGMEHAFARGDGMHYNKEAAHLANSRSEAFLEHNLK